MSDIRFDASSDGEKITLQVFGVDEPGLTEESLRHRFSLTEYRRYLLNDESVQKACKTFKQLQLEANRNPDAAQAEGPAVSMVVAERRDACVDVEISEDKLRCHLVIITAFGGRNPDVEAIGKLLRDADVVQGLKTGIIQSLASKLENLAPGTRVRELVAEGKVPGETRQARLEYRVVPVQDRLTKPVLRDDGTVDMHDFGEIEMVQPGTILMERFPPEVGEPGFNVLGDILYAEKPLDYPLKPGEGTELSPSNKNLLLASRKGVAMRVEGGMEVADAYCVRDVDLKTGNIQFDGTVMVQGSVREGMSIKAGGDVMVRDYVESATIEAGGNVIVGKGILGRQIDDKEGAASHVNSAKVVCGGNLHVNYAQYADIQVGNQVKVTKHLMHCHVLGREILVVSPKKTEGKIVGGNLYPLERLECNVLGAPSYVPVLVDFSRRLDTELGELSSINGELGERVNVIRGMMAALRQFEAKPGCAETEEQIQKIRNTVRHFEELIVDLKARRTALLNTIESIRQGFELVIQRNLFPGVSVRFVGQDNPVRDERGPSRIKAKEKADTIAYFTL